MASDLKMEMFAHNQFYILWSNTGNAYPMNSTFEVYADECAKVDNYSECCDDVFFKAINCRFVLFLGVYINSIDRDEVLSWESLSDFHDFVNRLCDRDDLFGHLTIFEKIFSTFSCLLSYCISVFRKSRVEVFSYIHIMWAMYFDKFIDEFYNEGGWNELKQVAETYIEVHNLFPLDDKKTTEITFVSLLKGAAINYCQFKNGINHYYWNYKHKEEIHLSLLWVKLRTKYFDQYITVPSRIENLDDCLEIEMLLLNLKRLCNTSQNDYGRIKILQEKYKKSVWPSGILDSKMYDNNQEIESDVDLLMQNLTTSELACDELLIECFQSIENIFSNDIIDMNEHSETSKECSFKTAKPMSRNKESLDSYSQYECKNTHDELSNLRLESNTKMTEEIAVLKLPLSSIDRENEEYFFSCIDEYENLQFEAFEASKIISMNQDNFDGYRKTPKNLYSTSDLCYRNQTEEHDFFTAKQTEEHDFFTAKQTEERDFCTAKQTEEHDFCTAKQTEELDLIFGNLAVERSESPMDTSFGEENEVVYNEITDVLSTDQTSTDCCNKKIILNHIRAANNFLTKVLVTNNIEEKTVRHNAKDELRKEQKDPEIKKLLRMILILGGTQKEYYAHEEVSGNEESQEISQKKSRKRKKRSKKKTSSLGNDVCK